jgi:hypothetical protein
MNKYLEVFNMIEMIFEGGYIYHMAESEYTTLLVLAGLGAATVMGIILTIGVFLVKGLRYILKTNN